MSGTRVNFVCHECCPSDCLSNVALTVGSYRVVLRSGHCGAVGADLCDLQKCSGGGGVPHTLAHEPTSEARKQRQSCELHVHYLAIDIMYRKQYSPSIAVTDHSTLLIKTVDTGDEGHNSR